MAPKREIIGGLASVLVHGAVLAWLSGLATPERDQATPSLAAAEIELLELTPPSPEPLAPTTDGGRAGRDRAEDADARTVVPEPETRRREETRPERPEPPRARPALPQVPTVPSEEDDAAQAEPAPAPVGDGVEPGSAAITPEAPAAPRVRGPGEGHGTGRDTGRGSGLGHDGLADHSAYGSELVRLVKAEIDADPVPGLGAKDSIEVELEVLPSGRLARWGLGKYDYARVTRSTMGPLRARAILRRILRASEGFPPHPASFPRERYVVAITVRFRDFTG